LNFAFLKKENTPMSEHNKATVRRLVEELWNKGNLSVADELFAPTYEHHDASTLDFGRGPEGEKKRATLYRTAFPDLHLMIGDILAEGETVMTRWSCRGTHKGDLSGIAPTGKQFTISGVTIARFAGSKIVEGWVNWDALGLMQQLGVVPEPAKAKAVAN
jgi:predicted ester cyclase